MAEDDTGEDDTVLMARAQRGDREATGLLWARHYPRICRFLRARIGGSGVPVEDLASDVMERTILHPQRWRAMGAPLTSWLYMVARNRSTDYFRETRKHPASLDWLRSADGFDLEDAAAAHGSHLVLVRDELNRLLAGSGLTAAERAVLFWHWQQDATIADTARRTGRAEDAVKQSQRRAFARMR
ncbi:MAG TPA: RNA polymerase sigma factor, partial [Chloroflexota bacterium]|nr:RNA polymerase sigma factor [Chloroflexota bacterium]